MMIITVVIKYGSCHFWTKWVKWRLESLVYRNTSMNFWSPFPWKIRKLYMIFCDGTWQNMIMVIALSMYVGSTILGRSLSSQHSDTYHHTQGCMISDQVDTLSDPRLVNTVTNMHA